MTQQNINVGTGPDSYTGESLRTAFQKVNDNFSQLYAGNVGANISGNIITANGFVTSGNVVTGNATAAGNISAYYFIGDGSRLTGVTVSANSGNIAFSNLTISGSVAGNIVLDPAGDGNVSIVSDVIPGANVTYNLGSSTRQWKDLWLSNSTLYLGGFPITVSNTGALSVNGSPVTSSYGNANVTAFLPTYSGLLGGTLSTVSQPNITAVGTLTSLTATNDITTTSGRFIGNGSGLTAITGANVNGIVANATYAVTAQFVTGLTGANVTTALGYVPLNSNSANTYSNTNVTAFLPTYTGNISSGNISTGRITLTNGSVIKDTDYLAVAFGSGAGTISQGFFAVAFGQGAGFTTQGTAAVAIGSDAGGISQGLNAVAVGAGAGYTGQGINAVAIGIQAGYTNQANNSIIINATGATLNQTTANTFTVAPVRNDVANIGEVVFYNTTSKEVTYGNTISVAGNITGNYILGNGSQLTGLSATYSNANVASYLPTYTGNIAGNIVKNGYTWTFGTDSTTTFPSNISIDYSGNNVQFPRIIATSGKAVSLQGQGNIGSAALAWTVDPDAAGQYAAVAVTRAGDNLAKVILQAQSDSGDAGTAKIWKFDETGNITLPNGAVIRDTAGEAVAFGQGAGTTSQGNYGVAIGNDAGNANQGVQAVALGARAGQTTQGNNATAIGADAGYSGQSANATAVGGGSAQVSQGDAAVAVGHLAGQTSQGISAVAIGKLAGNTNQGNAAVAIGASAGNSSQGDYAVAIGNNAGTSQDDYAVAVGYSAGKTSQGLYAVAIGYNAGFSSQSNETVAIGRGAGQTSQGTYAVAIGGGAGANAQGARSIIINATGASLNQTTADTFTVAPVRNDVANIGEVVFYNITSKEVTYGNTISVAGNISAGNVNITGNIVDTGALSIITGSNGNIALIPNGTGIVTASGAFTAVGNITGGNIITTGNITGNTGGFAIGYRDIPQVVFTSNATLVLTDAAKHYYSANSANVITIPNNTTVSFNIGTAISIVQQGTANLTVTPGSGVTMYLAGNSTSSSRTLGNYGMATLMKVDTNTWFINGTGVN